MGKKFDILQHEFVPAYRVMTSEEISELLQKYNIKRNQLPKISTSDAMAVQMELKSGDIVEILRKSPTAGEAKYYRVVVDA